MSDKIVAELKKLTDTMALFARHQHITNEALTQLAFRIEEFGARLARLEDQTPPPAGHA